ncbi:MAG: ribonuclease P protein component [Actinomycetota bacterium]
MSLPSKNRIKDPKDFLRIRRYGERSRVQGYSILVLFDDRLRSFKAGVLISKSFGNAVRRNRIKRQIAHIISSELREQDSGFFVLVIVNPKVLRLDVLSFKNSFRAFICKKIFSRTNV